MAIDETRDNCIFDLRRISRMHWLSNIKSLVLRTASWHGQLYAAYSFFFFTFGSEIITVAREFRAQGSEMIPFVYG